MNYARVVNGVAVDVAADPSSKFHPDIAAEFVEVPDEVQRGWAVDDAGVWSAPVVPEPVAPVEVGNLKPTPPEFMANLFTFQERVAIRSARAADPAVDDFLLLVEDTRLTFVDLTLKSTQDAINYLAARETPLITQERAARIIKGLPPE